MANINTLIVDDNPLARHAMKHLVSQIGYLSLIGECANSVDAVNFLNREKADLILLDVEMPEMSGLDLVKQVKNLPLVIMTTAKSDYAVEAFEQKVIDYLIKPVTLPRFVKSIERAKEIFDSSSLYTRQNDSFFVRHEGTWTKIIFDEILYIQALGDYATIFTTASKYTIHATMKAMDEKLPTERFQRIHRSYIVAVSKISQINDNMVTVTDKNIPIAESFKEQLLEKLDLFN
jgi:DNA-binding LytR/AlgR family response regulator